MAATPEAVAAATPEPAVTPTPEQKAPETERGQEVAEARGGQAERREGERSSGGAARVTGSHRAAGACSATLSETAVSIKAGGGAVVSVRLEGGADLTKIRPATANWADIVILAEPRADSDGDNARRFTISSVSGKPGLYSVTFATPCGKQDVAVTVQ